MDPVTIGAALGLATYALLVDVDRYGILTVGRFRCLERTVVTGRDVECVEHLCERTTPTAERRRWFREVVVLGMPVARYGGGTHHYCEDHAAWEVRDEWDDPVRPLADQLMAVAADFLIGLSKMSPATPRGPRHERVMKDTASTAGAVFSFGPIVVMVICAAFVMSF